MRLVTGLVLVSHSLELAQAALGLATGLIPDLDVRVELAAGLPGGGLGTDTTEVGAAIERADDGEGVLVLADLGSGIMSAETALELIDPSLASRVHLSSAPVVEGLIGAYAAAGVGKALDARIACGEEKQKEPTSVSIGRTSPIRRIDQNHVSRDFLSHLDDRLFRRNGCHRLVGLRPQ